MTPICLPCATRSPGFSPASEIGVRYNILAERDPQRVARHLVTQLASAWAVEEDPWVGRLNQAPIVESQYCNGAHCQPHPHLPRDIPTLEIAQLLASTVALGWQKKGWALCPYQDPPVTVLGRSY